MLLKLIPIVVLFFVKPGCFENENENEDEYFQSSDRMVHKFWGIQDVTTSVGKLFFYKIPHDAFKGTIEYYDVVGEENPALPSWMIYDQKTATLEGVPSSSDIGDVRINVKAHDNKGQSANDIFVVEVSPIWEKNTNSRRKCKKGEGVTMISLIIDKSLNEITTKQKIFAMKNLARNLHIPVKTLLFLPSKKNLEVGQESTLFDNDIGKTDDLTNSSIITWQIGCKEKIWAENLEIIELVEKYLSDGTLSTIIQLPVNRSHIASSFNPFRQRRETPQNNKLSSNNEDLDDAEEEDDDNAEEDDDLEDEIYDKEITPNTASPVYPNVLSTRSHLPISDKSNPSLPKKSIIDSTIANHTFEKLNINPNSTSAALLPDGFEDDDDTTEAIASGDDDLSPYYNESSSLPPNVSSTVVSTSTFSTFIEKTTTVPPRYPPRVERNLDQIGVEAGKPYKIKIPEDIFFDTEDGNTRNLRLKLIKTDNSSISPWIDLDVKTQELYILGSLETISKYEPILEATDSDNMTVSTNIIIVVQYPKNARTINFEISLHMKLQEDQNVTVPLLFNLLNEIAELYNDTNTDKITVRNITYEPFVFTWANNTLPSQFCDNKTIAGLLDVLTQSPWSMDIKKNVYRDFIMNASVIVEKVTWHGTGLCNEIPSPRLPELERQNFKPWLRNRIDNLTATVGELKVVKIPADTFYDSDEPNNQNLKIVLLTENSSPIPSDNWLQFDDTNKEIYGLPTTNDIGTVKYQLVCHDNQDSSEKMKARHVIEVIVEPATKVHYNVEFRMKLISSYEEFIRSPSIRRNFVEKLARLFGDKNTSSIVISGYSPGSLIVTWHNKSLPVEECVESEILKLRKVLLNDDQKLEDDVNKILRPEFEAISADITPIGICEGGLTELHPIPTEINTATQEINAILFNNVYFLNSVLPIVIIVVMIFVAGLIACILYRRQRRAKWTLGDEDERRTYRNKGIPVIFQDELEERLEPTNKSPIIMKEEKPPLPPPEYQKNPPMATTALLSDFDDSSYQQGSGTYTSRSMERNGRSKPTPIYRKPPPYAPQ